VLSVLNSLVEEFSVHVHDFGELSNGSLTNLFVSFILKISSVLGVDVGLLKVIKDFKDGIDGITSFGSGL